MAKKSRQKKGAHSGDHQVSTRILWGLIVGAIIGVGFNLWGAHPVRDWLLKNVMSPIGTAFLRSMFMIVVPLVFSSLAVGVCNLGSGDHLKKLGWRVALFYLGTTAIAVLIGQFFISVIRPGDGFSPEFISQSREIFASQVSGLVERSTTIRESIWPGLVSRIVPKNIFTAFTEGAMLAVIFVSILFGVALLKIEKSKADPTLKVLGAISDASILAVSWIMRLAPIAVAALMIQAVSRLGLEVMANVALYVLVVLLALGSHFVGTFSLLLKFLVKIPIKEFYRRATPVFATAFSTASSNATMPTTIRTLEKRFGLPESLTTFCVPLGATVNMDGTAMFEVIAGLFIAQVFGVDLSLMSQATFVFLILVTSIGVAAVPGASAPILMSAMATVGVPPEGIALVLGVDRLLDMCRTTVNATGDMIGALYLGRVDGINLEKKLREAPDA